MAGAQISCECRFFGKAQDMYANNLSFPAHECIHGGHPLLAEYFRASRK